MRHWQRKFAAAFAGLGWAIRTQSSYWVHCGVAAAVVAVSMWLQIQPWRWAVLAAAITIVMAAEAFNTSLELLVKAVHPDQDERIGRALDLSAGAVLITAIGAIAVGLIALGPPLWSTLFS